MAGRGGGDQDGGRGAGGDAAAAGLGPVGPPAAEAVQQWRRPPRRPALVSLTRRPHARVRHGGRPGGVRNQSHHAGQRASRGVTE